jgi:hypothetical protein
MTYVTFNLLKLIEPIFEKKQAFYLIKGRENGKMNPVIKKY